MSITWRAPLLVVSLIAAIALGGCGGSSGDSSTSAAASTPASTASPADSGGGTSGDTTADSGGGSGDDFCQKLRNIGRDLSDQTSVSDPQKMGQFFAQVEDALKAADPPSELQNEWNTLQDLFGTFAQAFKDADFTDPQSLSKLSDDLQQFQDKQAELVSATTALSRYAAEHCGGAF